jgi:hypothetical protein
MGAWGAGGPQGRSKGDTGEGVSWIHRGSDRFENSSHRVMLPPPRRGFAANCRRTMRLGGKIAG